MKSIVSENIDAMVEIASPSWFKPIFFGIIHLIGAALLGMVGGVILYIGITEPKKGAGAILGLGSAFTALSLIIGLAALRRFRIAGDRRVSLRAGPGGLTVCIPNNRGIAGFIRLGYPLRTYEFRWQEVKTWYPFRHLVNGIPTKTSIVFEGQEGWRLAVDTTYFAASQTAIIDAISKARQRTDL